MNTLNPFLFLQSVVREVSTLHDGRSPILSNSLRVGGAIQGPEADFTGSISCLQLFDKVLSPAAVNYHMVTNSLAYDSNNI